MCQLLKIEKELIRISPKNKKVIEYSINEGCSWSRRSNSIENGEFIDICENGSKLIAITTKGTYSSSNRGMSWSRIN